MSVGWLCLIFFICYRYEMLAQCQRDFTPEQAANKLANLSAVHYKNVISDEKQ